MTSPNYPAVNALTVTIANGQQLSEEIDKGQARLISLKFGTMTGTAMTFEGSDVSGGTFVPIQDDAGNPVSIVIASDVGVSIVDAAGALATWRFFKLKSGSVEGAERTVKMNVRV